MQNFLGSLLKAPELEPFGGMPMPGTVGGFGGGTFDMQGRQVTPVQREGFSLAPLGERGGHLGGPVSGPEVSSQPPKKGGLFRQGGGLRNVLGMIGDAILTANGAQPIYGPTMQRKRMGQALRNYLGQMEPGMASLFEESPELGMELFKLKHREPKEAPAFVRELDAFGFSPEEQKEIARTRYSRPIVIGSPETGYGVLQQGGGAPSAPSPTTDLPRVSSPEEARQLPPGSRFIAPNGQIGTVPGGATASPSPTFR